MLPAPLSKLKKSLKRRRYQDVQFRGYRPSAVLVPLILREQKLSLLLTQRSEQVREHKRQICFPGGMQEAQDMGLRHTALRETQEELGILEENIEMLGRLSQHFTPTRYHIIPFVAVIRAPLKLYPNSMEIGEILEVPLRHFQEAKHRRLQKAEFFSSEWDLPFYQYQEHVIWGVTGRITLELMRCMA